MKLTYALAFLSSAFYVFSFAPWNLDHPWLSHLQWFAFVPILFGLQKAKTSNIQTFLAGLIMAAGISLGGFYWIIHATQQYGGLPWIGAFVALILFSLTGQLQIPLYLLLRKKALERIPEPVWVLSSGLAYAGIESFYPKLFLDTAGHAFSNSLQISQMADIGGPFFITSMVICFAESLVYGLTRSSRWLVCPLLLIVFSSGYGQFRVEQIDSLIKNSETRPTLEVSMVQANIGDYLKLAAERGASGASQKVMQEYLEGSSKVQSSDVIIWPETAYPSLFGKPFRSDEKIMEDQVREFSNRFEGTLVFGGYDQDSTKMDYNSVFFLDSRKNTESTPIPVYHKSILLMFGETLPFYDFFPSMKNWFPTMGFFGRGPGPQVFSVKNRQSTEFKLAPSICYEGLYSDFSAQGAIMGADALINVTNDSWFGPHGEPFLHFALTRFRSIETRLPMFRSTNTGITAHVDPLGRVVSETGLFKTETLTSTLTPRIEMESPFLKISRFLTPHWFERLTQGWIISLMIWIRFRKKANQ